MVLVNRSAADKNKLGSARSSCPCLQSLCNALRTYHPVKRCNANDPKLAGTETYLFVPRLPIESVARRRREDGARINQSLLALANCIDALCTKTNIATPRLSLRLRV